MANVTHILGADAWPVFACVNVERDETEIEQKNEGWRVRWATKNRLSQKKTKEARKEKLNPFGRFSAFAEEDNDEQEESEARIEEERTKWQKEVEAAEEKERGEVLLLEERKERIMLFQGQRTDSRADQCINAMEDNGTIVDVVIDSGCSVPVIPRRLLGAYPVTPSKGSLAGVSYGVANGESVKNEGESMIGLETEEGAIRGLCFQVAKVSRALCSVTAIAETGHRVVLEENGGYIQSLTDGSIIKVRRDNGIYILRARILPYRIAQTLGFTWQAP